MKKIFIIVSIILLIVLIGFGLFYFFGGGKQKVSDFFTDNDFGSFFDAESQSQNEIKSETTNIEQNQNPNAKYEAPILRQISFEPISGYTYYSTTSTSTKTSIDADGKEKIEEFLATSTVVRFQERATGHVYDVFEFIGSPQKVSNITEQKIYSTLFTNNKDQFLFQRPTFDYEQIQTTLAKITFSTTTGPQLQKTDISSSISDFVFNKKANKLVYSVKQNDESIVTVSNFDRTGEKALITLSFNEFLIDVINASEVLITTKASHSAPGYAYILNITTGSFTKILGDISGLLVKVSPDKKYYIYSESEQARPVVRILNTDQRIINALSFNTIPEKCFFSNKINTEAYCFGSPIYKAGKYPDDWYKGKIFNFENLYRINLENGMVDIVYNFEADNLSFDIINPQITDDDKFVIFQNKYDLTLWSIDLSRILN